MGKFVESVYASVQQNTSPQTTTQAHTTPVWALSLVCHHHRHITNSITLLPPYLLQQSYILLRNEDREEPVCPWKLIPVSLSISHHFFHHLCKNDQLKTVSRPHIIDIYNVLKLMHFRKAVCVFRFFQTGLIMTTQNACLLCVGYIPECFLGLFSTALMTINYFKCTPK